MATRLNWRGRQVETEIAERVIRPAVAEFGLRVEGAAKQQLHKGHGVVTGTLRRSIHSAAPGYRWSSDDVEPSEATPERGGRAATPERAGTRIMVAVGSGVNYAWWVHQGHHGFEGYHFITNAFEAVRGSFAGILKRHGG